MTVKVLLLTSKSWAGFNISPSLGLYNLKHSLQEYNIILIVIYMINCDIHDFDVDDEQKLIDDVQSGKYDVIGMSVTHVNMSIDLNMLIKLNNSLPIGKDAIFVLGGQEATLNYKQWLESGVADICFLGFAEYTFSKFCYSIGKYINKFHNNKGHLHKDIIHILQNLDGVAYIDKFNINNNAVYNPSKALTKDEFTDLFYDRAINIRVPYERYWSIIGAKKKNEFNNADFTIKTARLYTVSHCPRRCGFCSSQSFIPESQNKKSSIIMLTAYQVYDLVERYVKDYSVQAFLFSDDDFPVGNREGLIRLKDFCDLIIDAKNNDILPDSLNFFCQARALDFIKRGSKERVVSIDLLKK